MGSPRTPKSLNLLENHVTPTISIVVPVRNMVEYIGPCIESVLTQDYKHIQLIVIDGASTDGTQEVIRLYSDHLYYFISESDFGQSNAINKGFEVATGDILAWLNADEEYLAGTLKEVAAVFAANDLVDFVFGYRLECDAEGNEKAVIHFPAMHPKQYMLYWGRVLPTDASFWSRRVHTLAGRLDEEKFQHLAMDYDWLLRVGMKVRGWRILKKPISKFKQHGDRKTVNAKKSTIEELWNLARGRVIAEHEISRMRLLIGWTLAGFNARLQLGKYGLPRFSTARKVMGQKNSL